MGGFVVAMYFGGKIHVVNISKKIFKKKKTMCIHMNGANTVKFIPTEFYIKIYEKQKWFS